jgi:recombination associated protein RdgC
MIPKAFTIFKLDQPLDFTPDENDFEVPNGVSFAQGFDRLPSGDMRWSSNGWNAIDVVIAERTVPASAVRAEVLRRAERDGIHNNQALQRLKSDIEGEYIAKALPVITRYRIYSDKKEGWLVVNTASEKKAYAALDDVDAELSRKLGQDELFYKASTKVAPGEILIADLVTCAPFHLAFISDEGKENITFVGISPDDPSLNTALEEGFQIVKVGLENEDVKFVLSNNMIVTGFTINDLDSDGSFDGDFALFTGELTKLLPKLIIGEEL